VVDILYIDLATYVSKPLPVILSKPKAEKSIFGSLASCAMHHDDVCVLWYECFKSHFFEFHEKFLNNCGGASVQWVALIMGIIIHFSVGGEESGGSDWSKDGLGGLCQLGMFLFGRLPCGGMFDFIQAQVGAGAMQDDAIVGQSPVQLVLLSTFDQDVLWDQKQLFF
jgi:hypothetical protein